MEYNPTRKPDLTQFLKVRVVRDKETGQYETHVPELNGISTCGSTKEEALQRTDELVATYIEGMKKLRKRIPLAPERLLVVCRHLGIP